VAQLLGDVLQRVGLELLDEDAVRGDLALRLAVGGAAETPMPMGS
jgi:hypothetical protein